MRFTSDFPGGNGTLLRSERKDWGWEIEFLAQSKAREPMPLWFNFRLEALSGERVRLRLRNSMQCLGDPMTWGRNRPVYRPEGGLWQRVGRVENRMNGKNDLETWFEVPCTGEAMEFAFCYPYSQAQMTRTVEEVSAYFESAVIGYSAMERPIYRYVNRGQYFHPENPSVYLISRQHAGEVTGTWELDGIMRYLASADGQDALRKINWWFVPFMDTDGVEEGFYGKDQCFGDLNRGWAPWFAKRTELVAVQYDIQYAMANAKLRLLLDLHAPGHDERDSYFCIREDWKPEVRAVLREVWEHTVRHTDALGYQTPGWNESPAGSSTNTSSQSGWSSAEFAHSIGVPGCSVECTYQGERNGRSYEIRDYQSLGACLAKAITETAGR